MYALTENPTIYTSLIKQFWETASASTSENEEMEITATIDGRVKTITEASIRRHLKLEDSDGIPTLPNAKIFEQLALMGPKKTAWEQFSSNIATAIICLATNRTFNFSKMIFEGMLKNLDSRVDIPIFPTMLTAPNLSPSRITSSPSLSPQTHPSTSQQPPTPPFMQTIHDEEEHATMPYDSSPPKVEDLQNDLKQTKLTYDAAYTKLILRVKKLEHKGSIIAEIDQNPAISLVQDEGTSWIQEDAEIQTKTSADTEILLDQEEPTELVEDFGSGENGKKEISTANISVSTASAIPEISTAGVSIAEAKLSNVIPEVSTAAENLVYIRRNAEKRKDKDKGKAIMGEDESLQKKTKKQQEQEDLGMKRLLDCKNRLMKKKDKGLPGMQK
ncbi:hypothetical protein Tco_0347205 [Tanacetum coccineum]